ncbi:MAG: hypothetical protein MK081_08420 [Flavobacteriales bacterium]|nr:hypothetical protein [Flavobacteriales bacterium]
MDILFEQPNWLIAVCLLLAALFAVFLYRKDRLNRHLSIGTRAFLGVLRFVALFLLSLFLLHPLVRTINREVEEPLVVVVQDNSESLVMAKDSAFVKNEWPAQLDDLISQIGDKYEVRPYTFGSTLREGIDSISFTEKSTDISKLFDGIYNRYSNRNIGAVIIASDGIYNEGADPRYQSRKLDAPVFTIALGDTSVKRDMRIAEVANNRLAYLGNQFPIEITTEGKKAAGETVRISVSHKGNQVWSESLTIADDYVLDTRRAVLEAKEAGLQRYVITVSTIDNEVTTANNRWEVFIDVLETRQKILILAEAPHPDVAALRSAISSNLNYEVESVIAENYEGDLEDESLVIFHGIPVSNNTGTKMLLKGLKEGIPSLVVLTQQTNMTAFNNLKMGYALRAYNGTSNDVGGTFSKGFPYFQVDDETQALIRELPPLAVPFGDLQSVEGSVNMISQRVGNIETDLPLISFNQVNGTKVGVITGEGIWRWRMVSYLKRDNHEAFDGLISSIVQYMANREDRRQFRIDAPRDLLENERMVFNAEVYNDSYEAITDPEVALTLTSVEGINYDFAFGRNGDFYRLDAGLLPVGDYNWEATTIIGGRNYSERGSLSIAPVQLEMATTTADHKLLYQLAIDNGGDMVYPDQVAQLATMIEESGNAVAVSYERKKLSDLINLPWILGLILLLLSLEWLLRKRSGSY